MCTTLKRHQCLIDGSLENNRKIMLTGASLDIPEDMAKYISSTTECSSAITRSQQ
jgi:hypothetical protein